MEDVDASVRRNVITLHLLQVVDDSLDDLWIVLCPTQQASSDSLVGLQTEAVKEANKQVQMTICTGEGFLHGYPQEVIQGEGTVCVPICSQEAVEFFCVPLGVTVEHVDCSQKLLNAQMNKAVD